MLIQQQSTGHTGIRVSQTTLWALWALWLIVSALTGLFTPTAYGKGDIEFDVNKAIITLHKYPTDLDPIYQHVTPENRQALLHKLTYHSIAYYRRVRKASSVEERVHLAIEQIHYYRQIDYVKILEIKFKGQTSTRKRYELYSDNTLITFRPLLYLGDTDTQLKLLLETLKMPSPIHTMRTDKEDTRHNIPYTIPS